ncbi:MAG TPA: glycosyl hydrolase family 32 [Glaciibacter sp.]|nr:glycosyl hydrolase family 32 [Glaciibacter sp.]
MALVLPDKWIWDSWFVRNGDTVHVFYLHASRALGDPERRHLHPIVGHAISTDLVNWTVLRDALTVSEAPAFDDGTTWTGSVIRDDDGTWWMFYTGTSLAEDKKVQRIGAATSSDLVTWTKVSTEPLIEADPAAYELLDRTLWHDEAWRDPWVFRFPDESRWHMLITARVNHGEPSSRGVMGHAVSDNLRDWTVLPPLSAPGQGFGQLEVLQFATVDGVPLILFSCGASELDVERVAAGDVGGIYSVVVDPRLENVDFTRARLFERTDLYAGRLVQDAAGGWNLIAFVNIVDHAFVGTLSDPIPVSAHPEYGLMRRASEIKAATSAPTMVSGAAQQ